MKSNLKLIMENIVVPMVVVAVPVVEKTRPGKMRIMWE